MSRSSKYAAENLNFCVIASLTDTYGGGEKVIELVYFPYQYGGEAKAVAEAKRHVAEVFVPKLTGNMDISICSAAKPADEHWPRTSRTQ